MDFDQLTWSPEVSEGDWIRARLGPFGGFVGSVVPGGFAAYARVLHPVDTDRTWADVCAETGAHPHALMQWYSITRHEDRSDRADGTEPREGHLEAAALRQLCQVLDPNTGTQKCWFALWNGYGWTSDVSDPATRQLFPAGLTQETIDNHKLELPHREYHLFTGNLTAAQAMGRWPNATWFIPQSPNLFWPADRTWCVATEIDFDSTLVGGSRALIDDLLASGLEAWEIDPDASLAIDGDIVNDELS